MKLAIFTVIALLPTLAHAGFVCNSANRGPDHGIFVQETENGNAEVYMQSIAGPQKLAALECYTPEGDGRSGNIPHTTLLCHDTKANGYVFQMSSGGIAGVTAMLSRPNMNTKAEFLGCRWN
ncbi:MAG: hypothetical protein ACXWQO_11400 [Bdellovibrionota bacterium]